MRVASLPARPEPAHAASIRHGISRRTVRAQVFFMARRRVWFMHLDQQQEALRGGDVQWGRSMACAQRIGLSNTPEAPYVTLPCTVSHYSISRRSAATS